MKNSWEEAQLHVMSQLKDLKEGMQRQDDDHARVKQALAEIKADLQGFKTTQRWELRIMSAFWGLLMMGLNAMMGRHG